MDDDQGIYKRKRTSVRKERKKKESGNKLQTQPFVEYVVVILLQLILYFTHVNALEVFALFIKIGNKKNTVFDLFISLLKTSLTKKFITVAFTQ